MSSLVRLVRDNAVFMEPIPTGVQDRGAPKASVEAVLFDVYGTLFMSASGDLAPPGKQLPAEARRTLGSLLRKYGIGADPSAVHGAFVDEIRAVHARLREKGVDCPEVDVRKVWGELLGFRDAGLINELAVEYEAVFNPVWPMLHADRMIARLREHGVLLGIVSNAQFFTPLLFRAFFGGQPDRIGFERDLLFYSYRYGRAKPSAFLHQRAAEALGKRGIPVPHCLYVGNDMLNDVLPASVTGYQTALFAGDRRSLRLREEDPRCRSLHPDMVVTDLGELAEVIINDLRSSKG
jgi:putative hydrolase of the HAD superfamily